MTTLLNKLTAAQMLHLTELQDVLEYKFCNTKILLQALTHRSFAFEHVKMPRHDNETLEFLGDAVLDLAVGFMLFRRYPGKKEGDLTKIRSALVQEGGLAQVANEINLGKYMLLGKGEDNSGGRQKDSILSCTYEAVIGAVFVDGGYEKAVEIIRRHFAAHLKIGRDTGKITDAKSRLQELTQSCHGHTPTYRLEDAQGPDHDKIFTVAVELDGKKLAAASAKSKKAAEQKAAAQALAELTGSSPL